MNATAIEKQIDVYNNNSNIINVLDMINPAFYDLWLSEQTRIIAKGGRSSFKSSVISIKLVVDFLDDSMGNVVIFRKVGKYLRTSVYEQIKWAIYMLGVDDEFIFGKSPLQITHKSTNTAFYFYGVDDPQKLKSMNIAVGYVMALWFEELAEFAGVEDIDTVEDTFIRKNIGDGKEVKVYFSYNPPRNQYAWVNEWVDSKTGDDDYLIHSSTYMDDELGFLSEQMLRKIEQYKENDYDYWRWMYKGDIIGMGDTIYNMNHFQSLQQLPNDDSIMFIDIAIDTGHQTSATTYLALGYTKRRNVILLDTYYYSPEDRLIKKAPSELSQEYKQWEDNIRAKFKKPIDTRTIDSAEGALRNQIFKDYGIRLHPVNKKDKENMIDYTTDLLVEKRFYYLDTENNRIFIEEHKKYRWDSKTLKPGRKPKPVEVDDHTCDAFQYYVMDNLQKLGLVF